MNERFELPAELNIYSALDTRDALLAWIAEHGPKGHEYLEISARDVAEIDGAGLQLVASLSNMEQAWRLIEPSDAFTDACRTLGLLNWIDGRSGKAAHSGAV